MSILFHSQGTGSYLPVFRIRIRIQKDPGFLADSDPDFKTRIRIHALVHKKAPSKIPTQFPQQTFYVHYVRKYLGFLTT